MVDFDSILKIVHDSKNAGPEFQALLEAIMPLFSKSHQDELREEMEAVHARKGAVK